MKTFDFLNAKSPSKKMDVLERFIEFWYGPRAPSYGEPVENFAGLNLPRPLERFYRFAGRWPARTKDCGLEFFYTGSGYHHLLSVGPGISVRRTDDGFIAFYMEYQGDWNLLTEPGKANPKLLLRPCWFEDDAVPGDVGQRDIPLQTNLTDFVISHTLLTSVIEYPNNPLSSVSASQIWESYFEENVRQASKIWEAPELAFPPGQLYEDLPPLAYGEFFQLGSVIFWKNDYQPIQVASGHPAGINQLFQMLIDRTAEA